MRSPEDYGILRTCARTIGLMWGVRRGMLIGVVALAASMNLLGPASAWIRKEIFDAATPLLAAGDDVGWRTVAGSVAGWVALMVLVWAFANALQAAYEAVRSVYAYGIANRAVGLVARRAATLDLVHFEDSRFYDLMDRARIARNGEDTSCAVANRAPGRSRSARRARIWGMWSGWRPTAT